VPEVDADPDTMQQLRSHLESAYGIKINSMERLERHVYRVGQEPADWVARFFPAERPLAEVYGDAGILGFLAGQHYPAERLATSDPVTVLDQRGVLVTQLVKGRPASATAGTWRLMGELAGRLDHVPADARWLSRRAGALHHFVNGPGGPPDELRAGAVRVAMPCPAAGKVGRALLLWSRCRPWPMVMRRLPGSFRVASRPVLRMVPGRLAVAVPPQVVAMAATGPQRSARHHLHTSWGKHYRRTQTTPRIKDQ
jgi:hypothetical protein